MKTAMHPHETKRVTVEGYINEFGKKLDGKGNERIRPSAKCPACGGDMHTKGEANPVVDGIFSHQPNRDQFCPLKESAEKPYVILPPVEEDPARSRSLRASFLKNWKLHYALIKKYVKVIDIFDFIRLIEFADRKRIWSYRHIEENQIPYIFLVLKEFPPVRNKKRYLRRDWLRFWFDSRVRDLEDLWIKTDGQWILLKATYANPRNGSVPNHKQLKDTELVDIDLEFLNGAEPNLHEFVIEKMHERFGEDID